MILRPRQKKMVEKSIKDLLDSTPSLLVAPTGAGKTIIFSSIVKELLNRGEIKKACILAHRDELTDQNMSKFSKVAPEYKISRYDSIDKSFEGDVFFAMVQTLSRDEHLEQMPKIDLLVVDEGHHIVTDTYMKILERAKDLNNDLKLLAVTATPNRGDDKKLGTIFRKPSDQINIGELVKTGHLIAPVAKVLDIGGLKAITAEELLPKTRLVHEHWKKLASERQTVIFCSNKEHATIVKDTFLSKGERIGYIDGDMAYEEKKEILKAYERRDLQLIVNVGVLTEGWDDQQTSCVVLLRFCSEKSALIQMIGRGLRVLDNTIYPDVFKTDCLVLDFGISLEKHGKIEQIFNPDNSENEKKDKQCPNCKVMIPGKSRKCKSCGFKFSKMQTKRCPECNNEVPIKSFRCPIIECFYIFFEKNEDVQLKDKDLGLNDSDVETFIWIELGFFGFKMLKSAGGFNSVAWVLMLERDNVFMALGLDKRKEEVELLTVGTEIVCTAKSNDFLSEIEDPTVSQSRRSWTKEKITEKQFLLAMKLAEDFKQRGGYFDYNFYFIRKIVGNMTKIQATLLITFLLNAEQILTKALKYGRT
ncbi:hypothetical protein AB834_00035 [PVC group bacterium (ex Bugula neritina AB1)]|nr:hypothetical protein AB834_00035 [PVC group bacterium (ex Bugula neritina AB1)]